MEIENLQLEIEELNRVERNLEMELEDVLTDVTSTENSEDEDVECLEERNDIVRLFKNCILNASGEPTEICNFIMRFEAPEYRQRVEKKMKKLKRMVKMTDIESVLENPRYLYELERIKATYPNHGGREMLNELVAVYCVLNH